MKRAALVVLIFFLALSFTACDNVLHQIYINALLDQYALYKVAGDAEGLAEITNRDVAFWEARFRDRDIISYVLTEREFFFESENEASVDAREIAEIVEDGETKNIDRLVVVPLKKEDVIDWIILIY